MHKEEENQVFHCKELLIWLDLDMNFPIAIGPELTADGNNEGNELLNKRHGIRIQKRAKLDSQDLLWRNHPARVTP
ncbi:hypothetical protein Tco_1508899 [Tanacetum coccineum]